MGQYCAWDKEFAQLADGMAHAGRLNREHIKNAVLEVVNNPHSSTEQLARMLSQKYKWNTAFPIWLRQNASQFNNDMMRRLSLFTKHLVFGSLGEERTVSSETKDACELDNYKYIAFWDEGFLRILDQLPHKAGATFIDIGCGIGEKPFLAWLYAGYTSYGVELNAHTYELGRFFLDDFLVENYEDRTHYPDEYNGSLSITHGDAFDYTYEDYDVIYMYTPIYDHDKMVSLYKHVYESIRPDAIMIEAGGRGHILNEVLPHARVVRGEPGTYVYKGGDNG